MSSKILQGYPTDGGNKRETAISHKGPTSYTQFAGGPPQSGGDVLTAAECGLKFIEAIETSGDDSGTYDIVPFFPVGSDGPATQVRLAWFVLARTSQPNNGTNLSTLRTRLKVIGY